MCKVSIFILFQALFFLVFTANAQNGCPCDSFTDDIVSFAPGDLLNSSSERTIRLQKCLACREKLGLHYSLCTPWLKDSIGKYELSVDDNDKPAKYLLHLSEKYEDDCAKSPFCDIDRTMKGSFLIACGIPMIAVGIVINIFTPSVFSWGFSDACYQDSILIDLFIAIFKAVVIVFFPILGVALDAGGTACITIGTIKTHQYDMLQVELPKFKKDMLRLGISIKY